MEDKVKAVTDPPAPTNVSQLQAYLGMLNYYHRYIPNLASELHALYKLLKNEPWKWERQQQLWDWSGFISKHAGWIGTYTSRTLVSRTLVSRTLVSAERNYSQLEKEALAFIFVFVSSTSIYMAHDSLLPQTTSHW